MDIQVAEEPIANLPEHGRISIAFRVDRILDVQPQAAGFALRERSVDTPYIKDYDAIDGEGPTRWANRFDVSNWGLIVARFHGAPIGGAVIAWNSPGVDMLEGRRDLAVIWDLRVMPQNRGQGIGSALFHSAEAWARERACQQIKVETQNINVAACRFYVSQGCELRTINRSAYAQFPEEIQLLWYKDLVPAQ